MPNVRHYEKALDAIHIAVNICQKLVIENPEQFQSDLTGSLGLLSIILDNNGQHKDALVSIQEAVKIQKQVTSIVSENS